MPQIYLLRHGETVWNTQQRLQGQSDSPLTDKGRMQAEKNGERLCSLLNGNDFRCFASPLGRTVATAEIVAAQIGISADAIETDERLKEISFGEWEGKTKAEIRNQDLARYEKRSNDRWNLRPPGGENYQDVANRLESWLLELREETVVVISHGCAGRILRGIHGNMDRDEVPNLDESHEAIFILKEGGIIEQV